MGDAIQVYLLHEQVGSLEKTIMLENIEGSKKRERPDMRWINSLKETTDMSL